MYGFCKLVCELLEENGLPTEHIHIDAKLDLPGYFRASKVWDMLVVQDGRLLAGLEFKSQRGPSFGNNFNNRTEEAIGRRSISGPRTAKVRCEKNPRPWLGWLMLLEDSPGSTTPVSVKESHFPAFPVSGGFVRKAVRATAPQTRARETLRSRRLLNGHREERTSGHLHRARLGPQHQAISFRADRPRRRADRGEVGHPLLRRSGFGSSRISPELRQRVAPGRSPAGLFPRPS